MGDEIEITTLPKYWNIFYRVSSSGFMFEVKASGFVGVGLAKRPRHASPCEYWIGIGCANDRSWISKNHGQDKIEVITPNILSKEEYRRFYISWNNDAIRFGRVGDSFSIVDCKYDTSSLAYVTFSIVEGGTDAAHWKFVLPPLLHNPPYETVTGGDMHWVRTSVDKPIPHGAVVGGYENETLYIVRAEHLGHLVIGKLVPSKKMAYVSCNDSVHEKTEFDILCGYDFTWDWYESCNDPAGVFHAGYSQADRLHIYIGMAKHEGLLIPGTVNLHRRLCLFAFGSKEMPSETFELLVTPETTVRSAAANLIAHIPIHDDNRHPLLHFLRHPQMNVLH